MHVPEIPDSLYVACEPYGGDYARTGGNRGEIAYWASAGDLNRAGYPHVTVPWGGNGSSAFTDCHLPLRFGPTSDCNFHVSSRRTNQGVTLARDSRDELSRRVALRDVPAPPEWRIREDTDVKDRRETVAGEAREETANTGSIAEAFPVHLYHAAAMESRRNFQR